MNDVTVQYVQAAFLIGFGAGIIFVNLAVTRCRQPRELQRYTVYRRVFRALPLNMARMMGRTVDKFWGGYRLTDWTFEQKVTATGRRFWDVWLTWTPCSPNIRIYSANEEGELEEKELMDTSVEMYPQFTFREKLQYSWFILTSTYITKEDLGKFPTEESHEKPTGD